ncbi:GFA family protein [Legionella spiritensis]|uniref:GFA family protein n=1 Tax=Legionella spiritensis TaxID=452 RepID=UPI000F6B6F8A|nr:GFA family protein [Legionella spiritensis]VEG92464.1 Uncharacterized conserved protein [Legionella spiritensis]
MDPITGKCHCGKNSFVLSADPEFQFICYCHNCQLLNSGGHLCGMLFDKNCLEEARDTQTYTYKGGSGNSIILHFCPECSTQLYAYPIEYPNKVVIRANTLDNEGFKPQQALFAESSFSWDKPVSMEE